MITAPNFKRIKKFSGAQEVVGKRKYIEKTFDRDLVRVLACTMALLESGHSYVSVEFEVYGKVQGVYFTKYCRDRSAELDIVGWVKNSKRGTIMGKMQGPKANVEEMIAWLSNEGSPGSKIERCDLMNFEYLARKEFNGFSIRF